MKNNFFSCYNEVFNEDGSVKNCGRRKCIDLMILAEKLCPDAKPDEFGCKITGFMNEDKLHELKNKLSKQ